MLRYTLFLVLLILFTPVHAYPVVVQESEGAIEEPDSGDVSGVENSKNEIPDEDTQEPSPPEDKGAKVPSAPSLTPEKPPGDNLEGGFNTVTLQGLNKVTGRASKIEAPIGSTLRFGTLEIIPRSCWKSAPEDSPENAVLLEIYEIKQGEPPAKIFLGWMFSSSPGLSSLENPFYDITVISCGRTQGGKGSL